MILEIIVARVPSEKKKICGANITWNWNYTIVYIKTRCFNSRALERRKIASKRSRDSTELQFWTRIGTAEQRICCKQKHCSGGFDQTNLLALSPRHPRAAIFNSSSAVQLSLCHWLVYRLIYQSGKHWIYRPIKKYQCSVMKIAVGCAPQGRADTLSCSCHAPPVV